MMDRFSQLVGSALIAFSFPATATAQARCDNSVAIGHIKRLEGPVGGVTIVRAGGGTVVNPPPLTSVCPMDMIRTIGVGVAYVHVNGAQVVVRTATPWKPLRARANTNIGQNILAMVTDKFMPDLARTETAQRLRGGSLDPTVARVPSVRNGTDVLPQDELAGVIRVPVYGELWLSQAQLRGGDGTARTSGAIEGQDIVFDAAGLPLGRYEIIASKAPTSRLPPPTRVIGSFTLVEGRGPNPEGTGRTTYTPEIIMGLRALWLADTARDKHGLLAYQLATRGRIESIPPAKVAELVLTTLSPPVPAPSPTPAPARP